MSQTMKELKDLIEAARRAERFINKCRGGDRETYGLFEAIVAVESALKRAEIIHGRIIESPSNGYSGSRNGQFVGQDLLGCFARNIGQPVIIIVIPKEASDGK